MEAKQNSALRIAVLNSQFSGNMAAQVETIQIGDKTYDEIIDFQPQMKVSTTDN